MPDRRPRARQRYGPRVHIVGGGISGLVAALRLAQRGYRVIVYEERDVLGGNVGGFEKNGCRYDVYPHMFGDFYKNFWDLAEGDLRMRRGRDFEPHDTFKILDRGKFPHYIDLLNVAAPLSNYFSGVASPADVLLGVYSLLDGLSYGHSDDAILDQVGVEGFLRTRPYATKGLAKIHESILLTIWSLHGYEFSTAAYRRFIENSVPMRRPLLWVLTGDLKTKLITPLQKKIESYGGEIRLQTRVKELVLQDLAPWQNGHVAELKIVKTKEVDEKWVQVENPEVETVTIDYAAGEALILAVPPRALAYLLNEGESRVVDKLPRLSQVRRLSAEPVPVLHLYFKKKLPHLPKEYVLLRNSSYDLSLLDLSQNWHNNPQVEDQTALCVAASDFYAIPWPMNGRHRLAGVAAQKRKAVEDQNREVAHARDKAKFGVLRELYRYLPVFNPGQRWHDQESDIDWEKTDFESNFDRMLFCNVVGDKEWQPVTHYDQIPNLFFAGDCTVNRVRIATVESAIVSGLNAARGVWKAHPLGPEIPVKTHIPASPVLSAGMKALLTPWAYAARYWSNLAGALPKMTSGDFTAPEVSNVALDLCATPYLMAADAWQSMVRGTAGSWAEAMESFLSWYKK
ncbi:MAG TPA: FAD-dependent oxidoreductase [Bryobacteraceae bacterium]